MKGSKDKVDSQHNGEILVMRQLCKSYMLGTMELKVLKGIDMIIQQGEYVAIMGPSGSGKSTLLNLLGCLDTPTSGVYRLAGEDVSSMNDDELSQIRGSRIGFIFQSYNLISQLNIIENIEVPMYYQGVSEHESVARAEELAKVVGLGDRLNHRPFELSGGQQQRVAIARALSNDPVILLADEPTGNLDTKSGAEILGLLDDLHERGKTLIIVTHDENIGRHAQRTIHLLDGRIDREVYNHKQ
ncbi:MAG: ABC transporter ATP-binding protein [Candidatus Brocadiia bacterium]|nr:MAG: ABC transporter ATP-binding protein [Candidatus Brocadiia bacterium]